MAEFCGTVRLIDLQLGDSSSFVYGTANQRGTFGPAFANDDADGACRLVIAASDPGVHNWLDTMGYRWGFFWARLDRCDQRPDPVAGILKLKDLRTQLPAETAHVSAAEREAARRLHRQGAQLRHRC